MKKTLFTALLAIASTLAFSQLNMELLDQIDYTANANDIWGWVDPDTGTEYALVGLKTGVSIVDLSDPTDVQEIQFIPGANSTWRDIKTWGSHVYVTNESSNGLMVIDLSDINNITWYDWTPFLDALNNNLRNCHNIYIDEFGYAYLAGCNRNLSGFDGRPIVIDVFSDPGNPIFVGVVPNTPGYDEYSHDVYARDNVLYSSEIYEGNLGIYDVSDKANITHLASQQTPRGFTHNAWLNDAGDVVFTSDERPGAPIAAYDISDLTDIKKLDEFRPVETLGENVIPHNIHVWQDWLILSYYTDGGIIVDASRPENLIEVGNWDTFLGGSGSFNGVWGAYPFLPSGLVLLSDIGTGLYVCGATYVRACWLEGKVTNLNTGAAIFNADVSIDSDQANAAASDLSGNYKTGQAIPGTFDVTFSAAGFFPKTVPATLENGVLTTLDVQLEPIPGFEVNGQTIKLADGTGLPNAHVVFKGEVDLDITTDGNGHFTIEEVPVGEYDIYIGAWGYLNQVIEGFTVDFQTQEIIIEMEAGYQDDFFTDLGWTTQSTALSSNLTGEWERGEPLGTAFDDGTEVNPDHDVIDDIGDECFVTGNAGGGVGDDDVDNGIVTLVSPQMDLSSYTEPTLSYRRWFFNEGGNGNPNDALEVRISNGITEVVVETITNSDDTWVESPEIAVAELIAPTDNMHLIFETSDLPSSGHLVEAAVDAFLVVDGSDYPMFTTSNNFGCLPQTVSFSDQQDDNMAWSWTFEGGTPATSDQQNPTVEYNAPGVYDVTLEVTKSDGSTFVIERPAFITIGEEPTAAFTTSAINGSTVSFANSSSANSTFTWDFGDSQTSTEENPSHEYSAPGTYLVTLTAANDCGEDVVSLEVEITAIAPIASFSISETTGCTPFTVEFTDESENLPDSWEWSFLGGDPATSTEQNPTVTFAEAGIYSVQLTVSNAAGTSETTQSQIITVEASPVASFTFSTNGPEVSFINASANGDSYEWSFGDGTGNSSTDENPSYTFPGTGEFDVTLTTTNNCGISASTQTIIISSATATNELEPAAFSLLAKPNPFSNRVFIDYELLNGFNSASIGIYNVLGKEVAKVAIDGASGTLVFGDEMQASGVYFLRLIVDGKVGKAMRLVKL